MGFLPEMSFYFDFALSTPASVSSTRAAASDPSVLEAYFDLLEETLEENELFGAPGQVYNMD